MQNFLDNREVLPVLNRTASQIAVISSDNLILASVISALT